MMLGLQIFLGKSPSRERSVATESLSDLSFRCTSVEIAQRLRDPSKGRGNSVLYERQTRIAHAHGAGTVDEIPETWRFCEQRINDLLTASCTG
jgi:hypothetical protein